MSRLPVISGADCVRALVRNGFTIRRQMGSHIILRRDDPFALVVVPDHRSLKPGTLRRIIRDAGLTVDEFVNLLG